MLPVLELAIAQFAAEIVGFHPDNGSEYINAKVAKKCLRNCASSRANRHRDSNHSALAKRKNFSGMRNHLGYCPIPQKYGQPCAFFYQESFSAWLNWHRPCLSDTGLSRDKGKIIKRCKHQNVKTPGACRVFLDKKRPGEV